MTLEGHYTYTDYYKGCVRIWLEGHYTYTRIITRIVCAYDVRRTLHIYRLLQGLCAHMTLEGHYTYTDYYKDCVRI